MKTHAQDFDHILHPNNIEVLQLQICKYNIKNRFIMIIIHNIA